ncbi:MAG: multicopper oxidase domain-containing protein [Anaerolineae bacterium]|nr:multicopper oxidase domain-containing protein [Anaerolineae bacterium]
MNKILSRRALLRAGGLGLVGTAGGAALANLAAAGPETAPSRAQATPGPGAMPGTTGEVDHSRNGFNPTDILTDFDYGRVSTLPDGQTLREYELVAMDKTIEVAPGIDYPAWVYNGRMPGPTLRATEGDRLRVHFTNSSSHPHTVHFHGIHPYEMDGVPGAGPGLIQTGQSFTYEFEAEPFGLHLYHCHAFPLARHIAKGLYGTFIVDPKEGWPAVDQELVMVMNGIDIDFDDENDFYAVNTIPFHYQNHPIPIRVGEKIRIFLVNLLEFDPINSFHLHANFFHYYPTGTSLVPSEYTDIIMQAQAQRGILEFSYKYPGLFMFHAHKTEFAELGWAGNFQVRE